MSKNKTVCVDGVVIVRERQKVDRVVIAVIPEVEIILLHRAEAVNDPVTASVPFRHVVVCPVVRAVLIDVGITHGAAVILSAIRPLVKY